MDYQHKYLKYKIKYLELCNRKKQYGGNSLVATRDNGNGDANVKKHLVLYEALNFIAFNNRDWNLLGQIYDKNVVMRLNNGYTHNRIV